jgi:hypothetical protein
MRLAHWIAVATLAFALAPPVSAQPRSINRPGTIPHAAANAYFPERVGPFERSDVVQYDETGADVSASYNLVSGNDRLLISVYVYPAPRIGAASGSGSTADVARANVCRQQMTDVGRVIETQPQYRDARRLEDGTAPAVAGLGPGLNLRTVHSFTGPFSGREQEVRSETDLYCYVAGRWLVKYRASSNAGFDVRDAIDTFIRTGPWPGRNPPPEPDKTVMVAVDSAPG